MKESNIEICKRIKEVRKSISLTQVDFAEILGVNRSHISNIERGHSKPSNQLIKSISLAFYVNKEWLQTGTGKRDAEIDYPVKITDEVLAEGERLLVDAKKINRDKVIAILERCTKNIQDTAGQLSPIIIGEVKFEGDQDLLLVKKRLEHAIDTLNRLFKYLE